MTKNIVVLTGSARPNSAGDKLLPLIEAAAHAHEGVSIDIARATELNLPFYNEPTAPSMESHQLNDENAKAWSERITQANAVIWLMPEYNHAMTAIQKNAIDWLHKEWQNKPLGIIAYGFYGGKYALEVASNVMDVASPDLRKTAGFTLMQDLEGDGTPKDEAAVAAAIKEVIDAVIA